jgi:hypothetical protein
MQEDETDQSPDEEATSLSDLAARVRDDSDAPRSADTTAESATPATDEDSTLSSLVESIKRESAGASGSTAGSPDEWDFINEDAEATDPALDPKTQAVLELAGDAANLLFTGPAGCVAEESLCARLMASRSDDPVSILVITVSETPSQRLSMLQNYLESPVEQIAVIDVQNYDRATNYDQYDGPIDIRPVSSPHDLRRIGIIASRILSEWEDTNTPTTVCFHSLSDMLSLTDDSQRLFRFLHVLHSRIQSADARAHYHLDPAQHDQDSVRTFESLFDAVLSFEEDGSVSLP